MCLTSSESRLIERICKKTNRHRYKASNEKESIKSINIIIIIITKLATCIAGRYQNPLWDAIQSKFKVLANEMFLFFNFSKFLYSYFGSKSAEWINGLISMKFYYVLL